MNSEANNWLSQTASKWINLLTEVVSTQGYWRMAQHLIVLLVIIRVLRCVFRVQSRGKSGVKSYFIKLGVKWATKVPMLRLKMDKYLHQEAKKDINKALEKKSVLEEYYQLPEKPLSKETILALLNKRKVADIDPTIGRTFAYVYDLSKQHTELTKECFNVYIHYNALNPMLFNSLRVIENQVVRMTASLLHGNEQCVGNVTSCGTESLLLAMKTYRNYRGTGQIIMCSTGHPGINKGCHYVGLSIKEIPYDQTTKRMSLNALRKAISSRTVVVVCSAPCYPFGVVDDVVQIAKICKSYGVPLHVDSAIGGFILPFIQLEGRYKYKPWDFRVDGVTSINCDIHKYGYSPKGSSVLVYNSPAIRRHQYFSFSTWPAGIYISPTAMGTRNGGCLSSAWGSLMGLGLEGFREATRIILGTVDNLVNFIQSEAELQLMAKPDSTIIAFKCKNTSCYKLADAMQKRGFMLEKQSNPQSLHMTVMPAHASQVENIKGCLKESITQIMENPEMYESQTKAVYGMIASIPDDSIVEDYVIHYMDQVYTYHK